MKQGRTLEALAAEVLRQADAKRDFIAPSKRLAFVTQDNQNDFDPKDPPRTGDRSTWNVLEMDMDGDGTRFDIGGIFHGQVSEKLEIPRPYYNRMNQQAPHLLAANVNHWMNRFNKSRLVRTLDGKARAFLSDRYRPMDNQDLCEAVIPHLQDAGAVITSCEITDRRLYIKACVDDLWGQVGLNEPVRGGVMISNSEVGYGSLSVQGFVEILKCQNGQVRYDRSMKKFHSGKVHTNDRGGDAWEIFSDETRKKTDEALWLQVRDMVTASLDQADFKKYLERLRAADEKKIGQDPVKAIEVVAQRFGLNDDERGGVLKHLATGGKMSAWGLANALTRHSQDLPDYERATDLEQFGGQVIELPKADWAMIAGTALEVSAVSAN